MKKGIKKFVKGMLAIFTIKLLFIGIIFLNQSCQTEETIDLNKEQTLINFENQLYKSKPILNNFIKENNLIDDKKRKMSYSKEMELEASKTVNPLIDSSIELIKSYGITSSEISEHFNGLSDERLVLVGMILYASEKEFEKSISSNMPTNLFIQSTYANMNTGVMYKMPKWIECAVEALGVDFIFSAGVEGASKHNKWSRKALIKLIGKVGSRMLGPIGTALAVVTFIDCMW